MTVSELSGRWTFMVTTPLTEGTYNFMVVATDLAGNASVASTPREITIDLTAPAKPALLALAPASDSGKSRSEEHTSELQSLMRISYAVFCLKKQIRKCTKISNIPQYSHTPAHYHCTK